MWKILNEVSISIPTVLLHLKKNFQILLLCYTFAYYTLLLKIQVTARIYDYNYPND